MGRTVRLLAWRRAGWALAFAFLVGVGPEIHADDSDSSNQTPGAGPPPRFWATPPNLATNTAAPTPPENQSESPPPSVPEPHALSLHPGLTPSHETSETISPDSESSPGASRDLGSIGQPGDLAAHLLVVYNSNDPDSKGLATYYAIRRNIPPERVLAITCPTSEEINRAQYEATIREPIISYLFQKNWMTRGKQSTQMAGRPLDLLVATRNEIWAIVLMRGVPLKIAPDPDDDDSMENEAILQTNAAAVDSELALLPVFGLPKGGFVPNAFFDAKVTGFKRTGPDLAKSIILVTRLDGPKPEDVRRMIDDSLYAEKNRLAGLAVIDTRGFTDVKNDYTSGDVWLRSARVMLAKDGWSVKFDDNPNVLPATDPCNQVAIYLGWYSQNAEGPWVTAPNRFVRGAIAYHLHSFSANTVRSTTQNWVGPLITHGAAATMGTVYEPYLAMTPRENIFTKRMLDGDYFAEAAYASEPGLSWMTTVVGDPLYRPFQVPLSEALARTGEHHTWHDDWLLLQQVQRKIIAGDITANADTLQSFLNIPGAGSVAAEGLGDLLVKLNDAGAGSMAEESYKKAMLLNSTPVDRIRLGLKLAQLDVNRGEDEQAQIELKTLWKLYPHDAQRFGLANSWVPTGSATNSAPVEQPPAPPVITPAPPPPTLPTLPKPPGPPRPQPQ